jgi:hypothetical protein
VAFARYCRLLLRPRLALLAFVVAAGAGWTFAQPGAHTRDAATAPADGSQTHSRSTADDPTSRSSRRPTGARMREGTEIRDVPGQFVQVDGRFEFVYLDGSQRLRLLENLALERASRKVEETSQNVTWSVSGVVTEYHGANYLLVKRVVVETTGTRPAP